MKIAVLVALAAVVIGSGGAVTSAANVTDAVGVGSNASLERVGDRLPTDPNDDGCTST